LKVNLVFDPEVDLLKMVVFQNFNRHSVLLVVVECLLLQSCNAQLCNAKHTHIYSQYMSSIKIADSSIIKIIIIFNYSFFSA